MPEVPERDLAWHLEKGHQVSTGRRGVQKLSEQAAAALHLGQVMSSGRASVEAEAAGRRGSPLCSSHTSRLPESGHKLPRSQKDGPASPCLDDVACRGWGVDAWAVTQASPLLLLLTAPLPSSPMLPRCPPGPLHWPPFNVWKPFLGHCSAGRS